MTCAAPAATIGVSNAFMNFNLAPEVDAFRLRVRAFVAGHMLPLEWITRDARPVRRVDGASEMHERVLSRNRVERGGEFWAWG